MKKNKKKKQQETGQTAPKNYFSTFPQAPQPAKQQ
jgi:hypothetical protein